MHTDRLHRIANHLAGIQAVQIDDLSSDEVEKYYDLGNFLRERNSNGACQQLLTEGYLTHQKMFMTNERLSTVI